MSIQSVTYQIPRAALFWLLSLLVLLILPHASWVPPWVILLSGLCILWRVLIHLGKAAYPSRLVRTLLVGSVVPLSIIDFRSQGEGLGVEISVCLLILGVAFKLLEMRYRRDIYIIVVLAFMLAMTGFIFSQTMVTAIYNFVVLLLILTAMVLLNRDYLNAEATQRSSVRLAAILLVQSLPVMLILFLLVPRIAPLWAMPLPAGASRTGVTDEMTPGEITRLGRSGELAFRVKFTGTTPPHEQLYWRGLVLDSFDGATWRRSEGPLLPRRGELEAGSDGPVLDYDVILEPTQQNWLYGIRVARVNQQDIFHDRDDAVLTMLPVTQRMRYRARSYTGAVSDLQLSRFARARALQLPAGNPQTVAFAETLRAQYADDTELVQAVLAHFNQQPFYYTLTPPALVQDTIDGFLFDTRQGFCGHYAGAMVYLLRAAGIPARVVVGYQGAEYNPFEDYLMVYQYNAHAWTEVWLEGRGWVRFDPTAWVAPERIDRGMEAFFGENSQFLEEAGLGLLRFRTTPWLNSLRLRLDALEYSWNRWVISYDSDLQMQVFEEMFGENARKRGLIALITLIALAFASIATYLFWSRRAPPQDPALQMYLDFSDALAGLGLARHIAEGPRDYCARVSAQIADREPALAQEVRALTAQLVQLLYARSSDKELDRLDSGRELRARIKGLRRSF